MAFIDYDFTILLPIIIYGTIAVFTTLYLEYKIKNFRNEKNTLKLIRDSLKGKEPDGLPNLFIKTDASTEIDETDFTGEKLSAELEARHVLFVCMRCTYNKAKCAGLENCQLGLNSENKVIEQDVEDIAGPGEKQVPVKPGTVLYHKLVKAHGLPNSPTRKFRQKFEIRPTRCLSTCEEGVSIAFQGPNNKFGYQFKQLDPENPGLVKDILEFSNYYVQSSDGYSKSKTRPASLKATIAARIPPKNHYSTA